MRRKGGPCCPALSSSWFSSRCRRPPEHHLPLIKREACSRLWFGRLRYMKLTDAEQSSAPSIWQPPRSTARTKTTKSPTSKVLGAKRVGAGIASSTLLESFARGSGNGHDGLSPAKSFRQRRASTYLEILRELAKVACAISATLASRCGSGTPTGKTRTKGKRNFQVAACKHSTRQNPCSHQLPRI